MESINMAINKMHRLAQLLAAFGNSYLPKKKDDSQAALIWNDHFLQSQTYRDIVLNLNYKKEYIILKSENQREVITYTGKNLTEVIKEVKEVLSSTGLDADKYHFNFNYDLEFELFDKKILNPSYEAERNLMIRYRVIADTVLQKIKSKSEHTSDIFVWPHHFDSGMLIGKDASFEAGYGLGYAKADYVYNLPYYYVYNYPAYNINYTKTFPEGNNKVKWIDKEGWKGAILPAHLVKNEQSVKDFYDFTLSELRSYAG